MRPSRARRAASTELFAEVETDVEVVPVGEFALCGFHRPVAAFDVVAVREASPSRRCRAGAEHGVSEAARACSTHAGGTAQTGQTARVSDAAAPILTPDERLRVFISSTLGELAAERDAVAAAVRTLRLTPVRFELGARAHPPDDVYRSYLEQSDVFVGIYWQSYGWVGRGSTFSGIEDELERSRGLPQLIYVKEPAPERELGAPAPADAVGTNGQASRIARSARRASFRARARRPCRAPDRAFLRRADATRDLPGGTVTFVFADMDGSTPSRRSSADGYPASSPTSVGSSGGSSGRSGGIVIDFEGDGAFCAFSAARPTPHVQR